MLGTILIVISSKVTVISSLTERLPTTTEGLGSNPVIAIYYILKYFSNNLINLFEIQHLKLKLFSSFKYSKHVNVYKKFC